MNKVDAETILKELVWFITNHIPIGGHCISLLNITPNFRILYPRVCGPVVERFQDKWRPNSSNQIKKDRQGKEDRKLRFAAQGCEVYC